MASEKVQQVFQEILGIVPSKRLKRTEDGLGPILSPTYEDAVALAELLADNASEAALQELITRRPQFLVRGFGGGGNELALLTKPQIGTRYRADFAILTYSQAGGEIHLIELEASGSRLFTRAGTPARRLQSALGQVDDWDAWIHQNQAAFVEDIVDRCKSLPLYPRRSTNGSFLLVRSEYFKSLWNEFNGTKYIPFPMRYVIYIGRWSRLSDTDRQRLIHMNSRRKVRTFEALARSVLFHLIGRPGANE